MQAPKNGYFFVIDRETGEFISAEPIVDVNWSNHFDENGPPRRDGDATSGTSPAHPPGPLRRPQLAPDVPSSGDRPRLHPRLRHPLCLRRRSELEVPAGEPEHGPRLDVFESFDETESIEIDAFLLAWDPVAQREVWRVRTARPTTAAPSRPAAISSSRARPTAASSPIARATASSSGSRRRAPVSWPAPITYEVDGVQYVAVAAGWGGAFGLSGGPAALLAGVWGGGRVLTYKLGGTAVVPPGKPPLGPVPAPAFRVEATDKELRKGSVLYHTQCSACHGPGVIGGGSAVPDLRYLDATRSALFAETVLKGSTSRRACRASTICSPGRRPADPGLRAPAGREGPRRRIRPNNRARTAGLPDDAIAILAHKPPLRSGIFLAPFHPADESPTEHPPRPRARPASRSPRLRRALDRRAPLRRLRDHRVPRDLHRATAPRTKRIRLGTGVVSLPYHNPLMVADRIMQLDHQTRGRVMLGVGPGQLVTDAFMLGIEPTTQRKRMLEALDVIVPLLRGEVVTKKTDWFDLREAQVQLGRPVARARDRRRLRDLAVGGAGRGPARTRSALARRDERPRATTSFPSTGRSARRRRRSTATRRPREWRCVVPMHLAETREQARADMEHGLLKLVRYFEKLGGEDLAPIRTLDAAIEQWTERGLTLFGARSSEPPTTRCPDSRAGTAVRGLRDDSPAGPRLREPDATLASYELFARNVLPALRDENRGRVESLEWFDKHSKKIVGELKVAIGNVIEEHEAERKKRGRGVAWGDARDLLVGDDPKKS